MQFPKLIILKQRAQNVTYRNDKGKQNFDETNFQLWRHKDDLSFQTLFLQHLWLL